MHRLGWIDEKSEFFVKGSLAGKRGVCARRKQKSVRQLLLQPMSNRGFASLFALVAHSSSSRHEEDV